MKILVTGGHGFVGSALVSALKDRYPCAQVLAPKSSELNLFDEMKTSAYLENIRPDYVFHLAARLGGVGLVSGKPLAFLEDNLRINLNTLKAISSRGGVKRIISLGSSCCYADDAPLPNAETSLWRGHPENTYGICKLVLLEQLSSRCGLEWVYLIPPNIYGPGDHFGEEDAHFIPATVMKFAQAVREGRNEVEVWGDGSQTRDFVYVDDVVHFLLEALEDRRYTGRPINIGTGMETSVREVVELIRRIMGLERKVDIQWAPDKPTGTKRKVLDNFLLREIAPDYAFVDIADGLRRTVNAWVSTVR